MMISKFKREMNFLKNIDVRIQEYISSIIYREDPSKINFIFGDFFNFLHNTIIYFDSQKKFYDIVNYKVEIKEENNNFKNIIDEDKMLETIKIFYRIGLEDHSISKRDNRKKTIILKFKLDQKIIKKINLLKIFSELIMRDISIKC